MQKIIARAHRATRAGFGVGLLAAAEADARVVGLCADLTGSLGMNDFRRSFPDRFLQLGISEANMISMAAGLATGGMIPFTGTFANFSSGRVYDQIRQSVAYSGKNVKICASHAGLTLGEDGATHQMLEDIGMMRMLPGMTVLSPCDYHQTLAATRAVAQHEGPVYLRFGRPSWPVFTAPDAAFELGLAQRLIAGRDLVIFATGHLVWEAIKAEAMLAEQGIEAELINIHTIKPLDEASIVEAARRTGAVLCAEEHQRLGGLGSAIGCVLAKEMLAVPFGQVAVEDTFGESGRPAELLEKYGLTAEAISKKAEQLLGQKQTP